MSHCIDRGVAGWIAVCGTLALLAGGQTAAIAQEAAGQEEAPARARAGEAAVLAALAEPTEVDFQDVPLDEAIDLLAERHGIEIEVNAAAVEEAGATIDSPANLAVRDISLRSALNLLLAPHGLTWTIEHDLLTVTSREAADFALTTRVYPIGDLLTASTQESFDANNLIELLWRSVTPQSWDEVGGAGSISHVPSGLVISQTLDAHEEIARLLADLQRVAAGQPPENAGDPAAAAILAALETEVEAVFGDVPLEDLILHLAEEHGLQVEFDRSAIEEAGATSDTPVSVEVRGVSLRNGLELILDQHGLTWIVRDEVLTITSKEAADQILRTKVYPVADIVAKGFEGSYGVDDLSAMVQSIVAPQSWAEVGGPGDIPTYPGALVVRQTQPMHEEVEALLAKLRELPAEEFPQQASTRLKVYTVAGADPEELAAMLRQTIDVPSWAQHRQGGEGTIQAVRALPPSAKEKDPSTEELAGKTDPATDSRPTELPQFGGMALPTSSNPPFSGWLLVQQSRKNHERIESLLRQMGVLHQHPSPSGTGGFFNVPGK